MQNVLKELYSWGKTILFMFGVAIFITLFIFQTYEVKGMSMEPTFVGLDPYNEDQVGDRVFILKAPYQLGSNPKYGDIVIVDSQLDKKHTLKDEFLSMPLVRLFLRNDVEDNIFWIKRIIGEPGDTLEWIDGRIYRNGELLKETYVKEEMAFPFQTIVVPEDHVFIMGDNRNHSYDSRQVGPVPIDHIIGKVALRYYPFDKIRTY